jgi:hypothetical protein
MADAVPSEKLRQYLRELKPEARALLAAELERALLRGEEPPGAALILKQLRGEARSTGRKMPRPGNPQRLFFAPLEPFIVDDAPERKHRGRVPRACLDPIWNWLCRDLAPQEARTHIEQLTILLGANEERGAEQVARAFQDLAESRMREALIAIKGDDKARRQLEFRIGTANAIEHLRETAAILRIRDALGVLASRLPLSIGNLADEQLENVRNLLESPVGRHRDVFLHALLMVMSRLGSPWQLCERARDQRGDAARPLPSAELFRYRHAAAARRAARRAGGGAQLPPIATRCGGEVLRKTVRHRLREYARPGRRRRRQGRAEGREGVDRRPSW